MKQQILPPRTRTSRPGIWSPPRAGTFAPGAATTAPFPNAYSVEFDGVSEYMATGLLPVVNANATMSLWADMADFSGSQMSGCFTAGKRFYLGFNGTNAKFGVQDSYKDTTDISSYLEVGAWHHICLVADGGTATFYLDGVSRDTDSYTQSASTNPDTGFMVADVDTGGNFMAGKIDEPAIWSVALDAPAVVAIYNSGSPTDLSSDSGDYDNSDTLIGWWRMGDSGTGSSAVLDVAGDNNGALYNNPSYELDVPSA